MDRHAQGILLIILSAIAYSSAGFFTRLIHLDAWTMLFWRGLFAGLMILCVIAAQERRNTWGAIRAIGRPGLAAALCSTAATIFYINALRHSSVADVAVIFAAAPFLTAGLGWLWLGITETWITLVASFVTLLGVSIMVSGAVAEGLSNRSQLRPPFRAQSRPLLGLIELRGMAFAGVGRLWVSGLPERPSRVWRRQATYP